MFAVPSTRETRPVGVLQGGSGLARMSASQPPQVAALLKPILSASTQARWADESALSEFREVSHADQSVPKAHSSAGDRTRQG